MITSPTPTVARLNQRDKKCRQAQGAEENLRYLGTHDVTKAQHNRTYYQEEMKRWNGSGL
jgi:hypothetical protein